MIEVGTTSAMLDRHVRLESFDSVPDLLSYCEINVRNMEVLGNSHCPKAIGQDRHWLIARLQSLECLQDSKKLRKVVCSPRSLAGVSLAQDGLPVSVPYSDGGPPHGPRITGASTVAVDCELFDQ